MFHLLRCHRRQSVAHTPFPRHLCVCQAREEDIKIVEKKIILHTHIVVIGCHNSKTFNYKIFILSFPAKHIIWIFTEKKGRRSQLMTVLGYLSLSLLLRVLTWRYSLMNRGNIVTFWVIWFLFVLVRLVAEQLVKIIEMSTWLNCPTRRVAPSNSSGLIKYHRKHLKSMA